MILDSGALRLAPRNDALACTLFNPRSEGHDSEICSSVMIRNPRSLLHSRCQDAAPPASFFAACLLRTMYWRIVSCDSCRLLQLCCSCLTEIACCIKMAVVAALKQRVSWPGEEACVLEKCVGIMAHKIRQSAQQSRDCLPYL